MATKTEDVQAAVREAYLRLAYSLLIYLKHVEGTEERRQTERKSIHGVCKELQSLLHREGSNECEAICHHLERLTQLVDDYYPLEANAEELADTVSQIDNEIRSRFTIE